VNPGEFHLRLKIAKKQYAGSDVDISFSWSGLAGFFEAEGYCGTGSGIRLSLTQNSCPRLLHSISNALGYGSVSNGSLQF
jgi:hypothetical protein